MVVARVIAYEPVERRVGDPGRDNLQQMLYTKLVVFLFVQDSVRSNTKLRNVKVLLLGTS